VPNGGKLLRNLIAGEGGIHVRAEKFEDEICCAI
jgi:hypothetical protein